MRLLVAVGFLLSSAACDSRVCPVAPCQATVTASDDVSWALASFHVSVCVSSTCDELDVPRGGPAVALPHLGGNVQITIPDGGGSHITVTILDGGDGGTALTTYDTVHVVVTDPTTGGIVCDMTAAVIDAAPDACVCGPHQLAPFVDH